ncbi:Mitochondrial dicarboxylate transporter, partial [Irineochytrium annulatum]
MAPPKPAPKKSRWWYGGFSAAGAAVLTHPLDTIKVRLQGRGHLPLFSTTLSMLRAEGIMSFYQGLTASLLRQLTYSTARFAVYDQLKDGLGWSPVLAGMGGGFVGGIVGSPADLANVRMQADGKLPIELRRKYRNVFDALGRIVKEEGAPALFRGIGPNVGRAVLMTASQVGSYDMLKQAVMGG